MPSRKQVLQQEKADLIAKARKVFEQAEADERELTEEEREADNGFQARLDEINASIADHERQEARELSLQPVERGSDRPAGDNGHEAPDETPTPVTPFRGLGDQLGAVARAGHGASAIHPGLVDIQAATGMSESVGSEGGFLVQTDFSNELLELAHETAVLVGKTDRRPISANANGIKINAIDESSRADGSRQGGIQAYWTAEAGTITKSKPTFRQMELTLQKLTGLYYATDEELQDTPALAANVARWFGDEFGFKLDDALIRGTGAGMPLGILGHAGTVSVDKETDQLAATILKQNIENMYARMWARSVSRGEWLINQNCWPQLFRLAQEVGIGGVPVFLPPGGISAAPFGMLLGRPVTPIEHCESVGTVGDIMFVDFSQYIMIEKGGVEAASSIHVQFLTGETAFRFTLRTDGQPKRNAALTPYKGGSGSTTSSFISLATRV